MRAKMLLLLLVTLVYVDQVALQLQGHGASCSFEDGFCLFKPTTGDYKWTRIFSGTPTARTGPSETHDGDKQKYYIYTEANGGNEGDTATITSGNIATGKQCVSFWYNAYGDHIGKLEVKLANGQVLFTLQGNQGNEWRKKYIDINPTSVTRVIFTSTRGGGKRGDLALDDIKFENGDCQVPLPTSEPAVRPAAKPVEELPFRSDIVGAVKIGCFRDSRQRSFPELTRMHIPSNFKDPITFYDKLVECRDIANNKGEEYEIFGVEYYGKECYYGKTSELNPKEEPYKPYNHWKHYNCKQDRMGAEWSFYVYFSCKGKEKAKCKAAADAVGPPAPPVIEGVEQIGCFGDWRDRALKFRHNLYPRITRGTQDEELLKGQVIKCRDFLKQKNANEGTNCVIFGIQYWNECFYNCEGPDTEAYKKYGPKACPNRITGGGWSNMVYKILSDAE